MAIDWGQVKAQSTEWKGCSMCMHFKDESEEFKDISYSWPFEAIYASSKFLLSSCNGPLTVLSTGDKPQTRFGSLPFSGSICTFAEGKQKTSKRDNFRE